MFLRAGVIMMSVAFAAARGERQVTVTRNPAPVSEETVLQTVQEPVDTSQPWLDIPDPNPEPKPEPKPEPGPKTEPKPKPAPKPEPRKREPARLESRPKPEPKPKPKPEPKPEVRKADSRPKPAGARRYDLPWWAAMGLTVPALGIQDAPVRTSSDPASLDAGVVHLPGTSLPWDGGARGNVYLAGHRLGWPGTGSDRIFYRLNKLRRGDEVMIRDRKGRAYRYRVTERLVVNPGASWVAREVPGREMLSPDLYPHPNL